MARFHAAVPGSSTATAPLRRLPATARGWLVRLNVGIEIEACIPEKNDGFEETLNLFEREEDSSVIGYSGDDDSSSEFEDFTREEDPDDEYERKWEIAYYTDFWKQQLEKGSITQEEFEANIDSLNNPESWQPKKITYPAEFILCFDEARCSQCKKFKQVIQVEDDEYEGYKSFRCADCAGFSFEYAAYPFRPQKFFHRGIRPMVLREIRTIWSNTETCEENFLGQQSAGLHVHMSHPLLTVSDYPEFGTFMMQNWRVYCQEEMIRKWGLRTNNKYCPPNEEKDDDNLHQKYLMMNMTNSFNKGETLWHVEFRGYRALNPHSPGAVRRLDEYIHDLGNIYAGCCEKFLTQGGGQIFPRRLFELLHRPSRVDKILRKERAHYQRIKKEEEEDSAAGGGKKRRRLKLVDLFPNLRF